MTCPQCGMRRARRECPALGRDICAVCCGTKRLVEIRCPQSCGYLRSAEAHPPAALVRQRERDARFIMPMVHQLSEGSYSLLLLLQDVIRRHKDGAIPAIHDADVAEAAGALAATLETTARGIIYDHHPASLPAQRLMEDLRAALEGVVKAGVQAARVEREAALALRRVERAARAAREALGNSPTAYLELLGRLPQRGSGQGKAPRAGTPNGAGGQVDSAKDGPRLVIP